MRILFSLASKRASADTFRRCLEKVPTDMLSYFLGLRRHREKATGRERPVGSLLLHLTFVAPLHCAASNAFFYRAAAEAHAPLTVRRSRFFAMLTSLDADYVKQIAQ